MPRFKLVVDYDGSPYAGFQRQKNGLAVQQVLEEAIERFAGHPVRLTCAGRTDAGVHAFAQVIHVDIDKDLPAGTVRDAANAHLRPHPVSVISAEEVDRSFDARRSAIGRTYLYRILDRRAPGQTPTLSTTGGTSDARFIKDYCPVVEFGLVGSTMHQVDERVPVADLNELFRIYGSIFDSYFSKEYRKK